MTGIGALLGVPAQAYGGYQIATGAARVHRGIGQFDPALDNPTVKSSPFDYGWDLTSGLLPNLNSPIDFLAGLP